MEAPGSTAALYTQRLSVENVDGVCLSPDACVQTDPLVPLIAVVMTGLLAAVVAVTLVRLTNARSAIEEERERTVAERDAFAEFARRIEGMDASAAGAAVQATGPVAHLSGSGSGTDRTLERVKDVYRDTVMDVPHYEEDYGEPLATNLAAEFGDDLATAVFEGTSLTPQMQGALVRESREARSRREEFLATLDREAEAVEDARGTLSEVERSLDRLDREPLSERSFGDLVEVHGALERLEETCEALLERRQRDIRERGDRGDGDAIDLQTYLYQSLEVTHPVLAAGASTVERVRTARRRLTRALLARA